MADLPTRLDYFNLGRQFLISRAKKIDPAQIDTAGSDANLYVGAASVLAHAVTKHLAYRTGALILDAIEDDDDLDRYAWDRYRLTRKGASAAVGEISITRSSLTTGAGSIPAGTLLNTLTNVDYITTTVASFGAADYSSKCNVRAVQAGKATQVGKNQIRRFKEPGALFDTTLSPVNLAATAGGEDREDLDTFKNRIRDFWRTARRGTLGAIEFGAMSVPGVTSAMAVEALEAGGMPARVVNLYIADSSGVANKQLCDLVTAALLDYRAGGIAVLLFSSLPQIVSIALALTFRANVDTVAITEAVRAAVVEYVNSLPVNGSLLRAGLESVLQRYADDGLVVDESTLLSPTGDLVPDLGRTLRTTEGNVSIV